jgi:hypothetical protein
MKYLIDSYPLFILPLDIPCRNSFVHDITVPHPIRTRSPSDRYFINLLSASPLSLPRPRIRVALARRRLAYWVGYGFTPITGSKAWRIPVALQCIFIIPILLLVLIVPESPRWLASHNRPEESKAVLARLQGKPITHSDVLIQHEEIQLAVKLETRAGSGSWKDLLKEDEIMSRRRLLIACSIQFFQQIGGINALIYYA